MRNAKAYVGTILVSLAALFCVSCGDSQRNSQGTSVSFNGYYSEADEEKGLVGAVFPLNWDAELGKVPEVTYLSGDSAIMSDTFAGFTNHLTGQAVRMERMRISYYIPGANRQPPDTSVGISTLMGPAGAASSSQSSLPDSFYDGTTTQYADMNIVPADIFTWLNFYRSELPEPPFVMIVSAYATGTTTAGHNISTNTVEFDVHVTTDVVIRPTPGSDTSDSSVLAEE